MIEAIYSRDMHKALASAGAKPYDSHAAFKAYSRAVDLADIADDLGDGVPAYRIRAVAMRLLDDIHNTPEED